MITSLTRSAHTNATQSSSRPLITLYEHRVLRPKPTLLLLLLLCVRRPVANFPSFHSINIPQCSTTTLIPRRFLIYLHATHRQKLIYNRIIIKKERAKNVYSSITTTRQDTKNNHHS